MLSKRTKLLGSGLGVAAAVVGVNIGLRLTLYSAVSGTTGTPAARAELFKLLQPVAVTKSNIASTVIKDKYTTWAKICVGAYKKYCPKH